MCQEGVNDRLVIRIRLALEDSLESLCPNTQICLYFEKIADQFLRQLAIHCATHDIAARHEGHQWRDTSSGCTSDYRCGFPQLPEIQWRCD